MPAYDDDDDGIVMTTIRVLPVHVNGSQVKHRKNLTTKYIVQSILFQRLSSI